MPCLMLLLALGGCASTEDSIPDWAGAKGDAHPASLFNFKETAKFDVRWRSNVGDPGSDILQTSLTSDAIYCATDKGSLLRLDRATGKNIWRIETGLVISRRRVQRRGMVLWAATRVMCWHTAKMASSLEKSGLQRSVERFAVGRRHCDGAHRRRADRGIECG